MSCAPSATVFPCVPLPIPFGTATDGPGSDLGRFAELVLIYHYLSNRFAGLATDAFFFDNTTLNVLGRTVGSFFGIDRNNVAAQIHCLCESRKGTESFFNQWAARPDIVDLNAREFYEIKPDNQGGIAAGLGDLRYYHCIFECIEQHRRRLRLIGNRNNLPLRLGVKFTPPCQVLIVPQTPQTPALFLEFRRAQPGLLVYRYCLDAIATGKALEELRKKLEDRIREWKEAIRRGLGPRGLGGLVPVPVPATGQHMVEPARQALDALPAPAPQPVLDVFDEIHKRLFTERELQVMLVGLLLAPLVGIAIVELGPALASSLAAVARSGAGLRLLLARAAPAAAAVALHASVANAKEKEANAASAEARSASTAVDRAQAATRAKDAAREATTERDAAVSAERRLGTTEREIAVARAQFAAAITQYQANLKGKAGNQGDLASAMRRAAEAKALTRNHATRQPAMATAAAAARAFAARSAAGAGRAAASIPGKPSGAPPTCRGTLSDFGPIYDLWKAQPRRDELKIYAPPVMRLTGTRTQLRVKNLSDRYTARIVLSPPTCRTIDLPPGQPKIVDVVPNENHEIVGYYLDHPRPVPGYGEQSFQLGWLHGVEVKPVG